MGSQTVARYEKLENGSFFWTVNKTRDGFYGKAIDHFHTWTIGQGKTEIKRKYPTCVFK